MKYLIIAFLFYNHPFLLVFLQFYFLGTKHGAKEKGHRGASWY